MPVKPLHIATTIALIFGFLYLLHMYSVHGTFKSTLAGVGINR